MVELYYNIGKIINELIEIHHLEVSQNKIIKDFSKKLTYKNGHTVCDQKVSIL